MTPRRLIAALGGSRALVLLLAAGLAGCAQLSLPEEDLILRDALRTNFPQWKLVTARDLPLSVMTQWQAQHPGASPGLATGAFFGDSARAYAVLLTRRGKEGRRVRLVVLRPAQAGRFETFVLFSESPVDTMPLITTSRPGEYQVFIEGQSLPVPTTGVLYDRGQGRQKLFFWNVNRFQDIELTP